MQSRIMKLGSLSVVSVLGTVLLKISFASRMICNNAEPVNSICNQGGDSWNSTVFPVFPEVGKEDTRNASEVTIITTTLATKAINESKELNNHPFEDQSGETTVTEGVGKVEEFKQGGSHNQSNDVTAHKRKTKKPRVPPRLGFGNNKRPTIHSNNTQNPFKGFKGDLVGWRKVDIREFPFVVSIMHQKYKVHICTGTLLTHKVVLSYKQCVVRRKSISDRVAYTVAEANQIIVTVGFDSAKRRGDSTLLYRKVQIIVTTYNDAFTGKLVFIILQTPVPHTVYHHPVKMYSMNLNIVGQKLQEFVGKSFCEVITWDDTIICSGYRIKKPKFLKAYRIKILESKECVQQNLRLGLNVVNEWSAKGRNGGSEEKHCFVGMGGRRCGSAPGGPIVCGNSVYGIMSVGTACSEFGDYTYFIPLNSSELNLLFKQTIEFRRMSRAFESQGRKNSGLMILIIPMLCVSLMMD